MEEYVHQSVVDLELHFRSCVAQLRDQNDLCHLVSHLIRLSDDNPEIRGMFRDKISQLMDRGV